MRTFLRVTVVVMPLLAGITAAAGAQTSPVMTHLGHLTDAFRGTPEGRGLLPTAVAEARVVAQHAALAGNDPANLDAMKRHAGHILHAVDPTVVASGPGAGYGLKQAAQGVVTHIGLAARSEGASQNATTHASHIAASARNTVQRAERIAALAQQVQAATSAADAAALVTQLKTLADQLIPGADANGDGRIGWQEGEGGLEHVEQHINLLKRGEGS